MNRRMKIYSRCMIAVLFLSSCSMTKNIPDDDQLFTGLTRIAYIDEDSLAREYSAHLMSTKAEVEAALATAPNGALFGSSYHRLPWSWRLWVYNNYSQSTSPFAKWLVKSFGRKPVLMSQVNPALRASVASSVLRNNGFLRATVDYQPVPRKNPKESKIAYSVRLDTLFTLDSVAYIGFPESTAAPSGEAPSPPRTATVAGQGAALTRGLPFTVTALENERTRITTLMRNSGYYHFNSSYTSFLADTVAAPGKVQLQFRLADGLPDHALHQYYIGNTEVRLRRSFRDPLTDSLQRRRLTIRYSGRRSPILPRVVLSNLRLRSGQLFSHEKYVESLNNLSATGLFSSVDFQFTPRSSSHSPHLTSPLGEEVFPPGGDERGAYSDTLDLQLSCTFDKPYDLYVETSFIGRTIGRYGPEMKIGVVRRNAFRGAEKLDINLHGAYEWQMSGGTSASSYQYGADISVTFPRIIAPFVSDRPRRRRSETPPSGDNRGGRRPRFYTTPTTLAKVSSDVVRRPNYYKMHIVAGEWTYQWQPSEKHRHQLSPLVLKYQYMNSHTGKFDTIMAKNPYLSATMDDHFIPKLRYTYTYTSPSTVRHPIRWETTLEEAGNVTALYDLACGHSWNQREKTLFKNPYAQFLRAETDITKTWTLGTHSSLVGHLNAGIIYSYGNSEDGPFSELFYAGGANSIRAFGVRSVGPGGYVDIGDGSRQFSYLVQNGDLKLVANLEYRTRLFGKLSGALFFDAGNVWNLNTGYINPDDYDDEEVKMLIAVLNYEMDKSQFRFSSCLNQIALGTGVGLRYDLGFLVVRIDWGLAIHAPYDTGVSSYFNMRRFHDSQTLHFAIGYPF